MVLQIIGIIEDKQLFNISNFDDYSDNFYEIKYIYNNTIIK